MNEKQIENGPLPAASPALGKPAHEVFEEAQQVGERIKSLRNNTTADNIQGEATAGLLYLT